jgi:predicted esterase
MSFMPLLKRIFLSLLRILAGVPIVSLLAGGLLLLVFGRTLTGRSVGLSAAIFGCILFCSVGYWNRDWFKRIRRRFYAVLVPTGLLLYLVPMLLAPSGGTSGGHVRNCFLQGQGTFSRYSPGNVIPEVDQLAVGVNLLRLRDVNSTEAARLRSVVLPIYEEMDRDAEFHALGSVVGMGYRELVHTDFRPGHYYLYLPETISGEKLPCLVFLHGLGGNTKSCLWVLSRQQRFAVIAPTFGIGNWDKPGGAEFVVDVVREALAAFPLAPGKVFLMGYSNGAMGVTRGAIKEPGLFKGLIYLSPITEDELFSAKEFSGQSRDCPILFLHGGRDTRIPRSFVEGTAGCLRRSGFDVRLKMYDDEDHYLLFSQPEAVLGEVLEFMAVASQRGPRSSGQPAVGKAIQK